MQKTRLLKHQRDKAAIDLSPACLFCRRTEICKCRLQSEEMHDVVHGQAAQVHNHQAPIRGQVHHVSYRNVCYHAMSCVGLCTGAAHSGVDEGP